MSNNIWINIACRVARVCLTSISYETNNLFIILNATAGYNIMIFVLPQLINFGWEYLY